MQVRHWKGEKMKNKKYKKSLTTLKFFAFIFGIWKSKNSLGNIVWENLVYTIIFLVKFFLELWDI